MLWMNCNQELGKLYGLQDPAMIQSFDLAAEQCSADEQGADDAHRVEGLDLSLIPI